MHSANMLSTQRLVEYLARTSAAPDAAAAIEVATERAARVLEAEVAVLVDATGPISSVGFALGRVPADELVEVVRGRSTLEVPGAGRCHTAVAPVAGDLQGHLVVARSGAEGFSVDEISLLRGMARILELTVATVRVFEAERRQAAENARLLSSLQERQRLLEQLSVIQRAITRRAPLQSILDAITAGAQELLRDEVAALHLVDPDDPAMMLLVSSTGLPERLAKRLWRIPLTDGGPAGLAVTRDDLVVTDDYATAPEAIPDLVAAAVQATMAAPVHENSTVVGSLVVASYRDGRRYAKADREVLAVFAEHVSLAITDAKTQQAMTRAFHDPLTGLASRKLFLDRLDHALARAVTDNSGLAVLFVDLDRFKHVNDSLGHAAGDALLVGVADRLRSCLGADDTAARLGGDEFAIIACRADDRPTVVQTAERIIELLRAPFVVEGHETFVDASVGIAFSVGAKQSAPELIRDADLAMYQAKKRGKGRYEIFQPALRTAFLHSLDVEARLRQAVGRGDLVLHYQPVVSLDDGALVGLEALVRWKAGRRGIVPPRDFIPLAEETGLILSIEQWVIRRACRQGGEWVKRYGRTLSMAVNLSARQLQHAGLPELVAGALSDAGLDPACLVLEVTESQLMTDTDVAIERLQQLKALGARVAIDDFGTGYSSLAYLRQFPADIIKIDKSFVDDARPGSDGATLARAIVQLGRTMRLTTLAEGVETAEQAVELTDAGCDLAQGFYFSPPLRRGQVEHLLRSGRHLGR